MPSVLDKTASPGCSHQLQRLALIHLDLYTQGFSTRASSSGNTSSSGVSRNFIRPLCLAAFFSYSRPVHFQPLYFPALGIPAFVNIALMNILLDLSTEPSLN